MVKQSQMQGVIKMYRVVADRAIHAAALSHGDTQAAQIFTRWRSTENHRFDVTKRDAR
jgi:ABC-type uncharacterized transport system ATPase subunit